MSLEDNRVKLNNGVIIPQIGFGTFKIPDGTQTLEAVREALEFGYRHIDTAAIYENEASVGAAVKESGLKREDIFITSKLWVSDFGYDEALKAFEKTMNKLKVDYLDLYLLHWPRDYEVNKNTWKALERLYEEKVIKSIGVSNFKVHHLEELLKSANVVPAINQVELHPTFQPIDIIAFGKKYDIKIEAYYPFAHGETIKDERLKALASKYNKSVAQLVLRWHLEKGYIPLPKSTNREHIKGNLNIFDFTISAEDMEHIDKLNTGIRRGIDPDKTPF
ncbi:aldo/keto reductase [Clostridium sp. 'White wine YQ']|uniref:aldo/keto reductase n=1 Tax=Clostridium sp. 'White wine YQ' TaxID=3027474 RepID=UPI00236688E9|nr:aldo/keto reductase [Clostridium sp. 'White wine YQ']MDD7795439.1 aldo/keto reductase [Clostridium sp. 'White wine YQ']